MSIVDNKVLDPKLVANVDADLQPTKKRIMGSVSYACLLYTSDAADEYNPV